MLFSLTELVHNESKPSKKVPKKPGSTLPAFQEDLSQQVSEASTAAVSLASQSQGENGGNGIHCKWVHCPEAGRNFTEHPDEFWHHLGEHARENPMGPCRMPGCENARSARNAKTFRHHLFSQHMPKGKFRCLLENCSRVYNTPNDLRNHIATHPKPKIDVKIPLQQNMEAHKTIHEIRVQSTEFLGAEHGSGSSADKKQLCEKILSSIGITFVEHLAKYFVSVHGLPLGNWRYSESGTSFRQEYELYYPFKPEWLVDESMKITPSLPQSTSVTSVVVWKLPISSPLFRKELRMYVNALIEKTGAVGMPQVPYDAAL